MSDLHLFNPAEQTVTQEHRTPLAVQRWLRQLPYNWNPQTLWTFRNVVKFQTANCIEAALSAATILEQYGDPPLLLDLESEDKLDHVLFLYRRRGRWGTVAKSRDVGLHGRRAVFRTVRDLVFSYVDPYVDGEGRIKGYGVGDLRELTSVNWRLSARNVWAVERALIRMPHQRLKTSDLRHADMLRRYLAFRQLHPKAPYPNYRNREKWM